MSESLGFPLELARERGYEAEVEATKVAVKKLMEADVRILIGGDYGISIAPHGAYAKDLQYFVELFGMSEGRALLCATRDGGAAADPEGRVGTIEAGKLADMVFVDGDPLDDITVLQDHSRLTVMKGGEIYRNLARDDIYRAQPEEVFKPLSPAEAAE